MLPVAPKLILDVVPVDHVVAGMLMVAAQAMRRAAEAGVPAVRAATSTRCAWSGVVTLTGLYKRKRFQDKETGNKFLNELAARMEFRPVSPGGVRPVLDPADPAASRGKASEALGRVRPRWGAGRFTAVVDRVKKGFDEVDRVTSEAAENIELFRPFIFENSYVFRADNIRALRDRHAAPRIRRGSAGGRRTWTSTTTG